MVLWRKSRHRDLTGTGGLRAAPRWQGRPIVYLAESPAAALLEVCVHTSVNDAPPEFTLLKIQGPDIDVPPINIDELPGDWRARLEVTRDHRDRRRESAVLRVPSANGPETVNCLFNPAHRRAADFRIVEAVGYQADSQIKR